MNENFENNGNLTPEEQIADNSLPENGFTPEKQEGQPFGQTQFTAPNNATQYTPPFYGNGYAYGYVKPEAEKKPSKGKKKGLIVTVSILAAAVVISLAALVGSLVFRSFDNKDNPSKFQSDDTQMQFSENPGKSESKNDGVLTAKDVYNKVHKSSVGILVYASNQQQLYSEGSGIAMAASGDAEHTYVITCAHVIDSSNLRVVVQTYDGTQYDAVVVGLDSKTDIGLLRINTKDVETAEFADSESVSVGDTVYAIGNPGGTQFFGSFTNGMVSAIGRPVNSPVGYEVACIQHTAAINPGNSGGALVNSSGQVIGINSSKIASTDYEGMGFCVPTETVKEVVDELIKNGYVSNRPVLGITFKPVAYSQSHSIVVKTHNLPAGSIIIDEISNNSDLKNKDVKAGDMIIAVNGKELETYDVILEAVKNGKVGDTLTLTICRIDTNYQISTFDITVKLVEDIPVNAAKQNDNTQDFPFPFGN